MTAANRKNTTPDPLGQPRRFARREPDRCGGRTGRRGADAGCAEREEDQREGEVGNSEAGPAPGAHLSQEYGTFARRVHTCLWL